MKSVCVYCGSQPGARPLYAELARELGAEVARRGQTLVYGGGGLGLMGQVADAALEAGGEVVGVIPGELMDREQGHRGLTRLEVVGSMHERKARMAELAEGFVAMPGGMGTLEELTETLTWAQLGIHARPVGLLDVAGYWQHLLAMLDHAVEEGFLKGVHRGLLLAREAPADLLDAMAAYEPPSLRRWMNTEGT